MLSRNGSFSIAAVLAIFAIALGSETVAQQKPSAAQPSPPVVTQDSKLPAGDPCKLLTLAEVRKVFPNAANGTRSDDLSNGILTCVWRSPDGTVRLSLMDTEPGDSVRDELHTYAMAFVTDGDKWEVAEPRILYQRVDVGDEGMLAIVAAEEVDPKYSLQAGAMLVAHRRQESILLISQDLAARGRNAAYHALVDLGGAAAKRL